LFLLGYGWLKNGPFSILQLGDQGDVGLKHL
jgi:hypothetical protein